jgi:hypothetical protein
MSKIPHTYFDGEKCHELPSISPDEVIARMMQAIERGGEVMVSRSLRNPPRGKPPDVLDSIAKVVLAYRPKAKSKPAKKRQRRARKVQRDHQNP